MRYILFFSFFSIIALLGCEEKSEGFDLNGEIKGDYSGYLFLVYEEVKDSCLIKENKFHFKGEVTRPTSASLYAEGFSANDRNFYIENTNMTVNVSFEKRIIKTYELNFVTIDRVIGTETSETFYDFEKFKYKYSKDSNWNEMLYAKLSDIFDKNPDNDYAHSLLTEVSFDSVLDFSQLQNLYSKLDFKDSAAQSKSILENNVFPERRVKVGDMIKDFELPNELGENIKTLDFRGSYLLIDFWSSWCLPCRKQFPELKRIADNYKDKGFKVLGVSIDEDKEKWKKAIKTDALNWVNVIDGGALNNDVAIEYGVFVIPSNLLIDPDGKILEKNISLELLETKLNEIQLP